MKTAVVYFSRTHTTEMLANTIAQQLNADVLEVKSTLYPYGFWGYLRAMRDAMSEKNQFIKTGDWMLNKYDLVVIGTPVWGHQMSAPIRSFLYQNRKSIKALAFFATCSSSGAEKAMAKMAALAEATPVATLKITAAELASGAAEKKVSGFVKNILNETQNLTFKPALQTEHPA
jgi:flavodoxin